LAPPPCSSTSTPEAPSRSSTPASTPPPRSTPATTCRAGATTLRSGPLSATRGSVPPLPFSPPSSAAPAGSRREPPCDPLELPSRELPQN
jgi:hypothetical protein